MRRGLPRVARQVHDVGFRGEGKRYKLVTFSLLYPARHRRLAEGLQMEGPVLWWVSSPVENLLEAVVLGLLAVGSPDGLCRTGRGRTAPAAGRYDDVADALARLCLDGPDAGRSLSTRPTPTRLGPWAGRLPTRRSGWSG
jgi:hypothetical protein